MFNLGLFLSYAFVVSFTPGPNNIMSLYNASHKGFKKGLSFNLGVASGFLVLMLLCSFLNFGLNAIMPKIQPYMRLIGTAYMLYLAYKIYQSKAPNEIESPSNSMINFKTGFLMQFVNPKAILYGITIVSSFIMPYYSSWSVLFLFALFLALIAFLSTSSWSLFGSLFTQLLSKYYRIFNLAMSGLLIYTAVNISGLLH